MTDAATGSPGAKKLVIKLPLRRRPGDEVLNKSWRLFTFERTENLYVLSNKADFNSYLLFVGNSLVGRKFVKF